MTKEFANIKITYLPLHKNLNGVEHFDVIRFQTKRRLFPARVDLYLDSIEQLDDLIIVLQELKAAQY